MRYIALDKNILVTGGAGYIGSHTALALLEAGFRVIVLDNLSNSSRTSLKKIYEICGKKPVFIEGDIADTGIVNNIFTEHSISAVFHFAGAKAVGESVIDPIKYYENNLAGSINLLKAMAANSVFTFIFSSSATVYGMPTKMPISEDFPIGKPTNPYGRTKLMVEEVLRDLCSSDPRWSIAILRYFNPIGAHKSGQIGESPQGVPNNLLPYISKVAIGALPELTVFGNDHPTADGTGVRDYIHVVDLAAGHLKALNTISKTVGVQSWNLGTGTGYSVLDIIKAFEKISEKVIPFRYSNRRPGDISECWSDPSKAERELDWKAKLSLEDMIRDTWRWQVNYPDGYENNTPSQLPE
jgi:UDP-glucose 4-epimerase